LKVRILGAATALPFAFVFVASCSNRQSLGQGFDDVGAPAPSFTNEDAATAEPEAGLTSYCPSNKCPAGLTTCSSSRFPCDVDLKRDINNCGACGASCPAPTLRERYECLEGRCVLRCSVHPVTLDCDGIDDNGCETDPGGNDHCTACGDTCLDPTKPCAVRTTDPDFGCGCTGDRIYCADAYPNCLDPKTDDGNCGGCGNVCDRTGDGGGPPPNAYYGCLGGQCGALKCNQDYGNCDGDAGNGCETSLLTSQNCGACGNVCASGQECRRNMFGMPECLCPAGKTFCPAVCINGVCRGECTDLGADPRNCGTCGFACSSSFQPYSIGICTYGTCSRSCAKGRADCNRNAADDCEVNTDSDPRNCGACGRVCDAVAGQACVSGQCVVEPCADRDAGGVSAQ
jgi:hypothetical protein